MSDASEKSMPSHLPSNLSKASKIRAIADGELAQGAPLEQDDGARVAFERSLKAAVGRVMGQETAPDELRERVKSILRSTPEESAVGDVVRVRGADTTSRSFWARRQWLAVAAVVAVSAAGLFFLSQRIAMKRFPSMSVELTQAATFVETEHEQCALFGSHFDRKFYARSEADAAAAAMEILDRVPDVLEFPLEGLKQAGYTFAGLGRCKVPGAGKSAHLIYRSTLEDLNSLSLFVQVDTNQLKINEVESYSDDGSNHDGHDVVIWRRDGFVYYLFAPDQAIQDTARRDLATPSAHKSAA